MSNAILEFLKIIPENLKADLGLYIGIGLLAIGFIFALIAAAGTLKDVGKFKNCAAIAVKDAEPKTVNAAMQKMPVKVKKLYKRAMVTKSKPSDIINVDSCVNVPYNKSMMSRLASFTLLLTLIAAGAGVGADIVLNGVISAGTGLIVLIVALLGGLLTLIGGLVSRASYSGAIKSYDLLMDTLDTMVKGGAEQVSAPEEVEVEEEKSEEEEIQSNVIHSKRDFDGPSRITVEIEEDAPKAREPEDIVIEQEPVQAVIVEQPQESEAEIRARAREEAIRAARAEQAARMAQAQAAQMAEKPVQAQQTQKEAQPQPAPVKSAAQRIEELKAQREAQLKAQREAQAKAQAQAKVQAAAQAAEKPGVSTEEVIARIEKINEEGATLPVMKEVAMLLQQERAKPENKTPDQQKKLNEALSKLLKAMSAASKK